MDAAFVPIDNATPVRVLQHPAEAHHHLNTARWVLAGLRHAIVIAAKDFTPGDWTVPGYEPVLLFPGEPAQAAAHSTAPSAALPPQSAQHKEAGGHESPSAPTSRRSLVVIDGTWRQANAILREHPALLGLPRLALTTINQSAYRLRKSPRVDGVSTVEAVALALDILDAPTQHDALLQPFKDRIDAQIRLQREIMGDAAFAKNYPHLSER